MPIPSPLPSSISLPVTGGSVAMLALAALLAGNCRAGEPMRPVTRPPARAAKSATPTPKPVSKPYLQAVGPTAIHVSAPAGPRLRKPPLLPEPKAVEKEPAPVETVPAAAPKPEIPVLTPDAPANLLPSPPPTARTSRL